ncbi:hypothetical protein HDV00_001431 [Rhizophlyctis rosea]|nr:hypothetical protein HDV00_001431 [Rhizophlyctis rosea]
MHLHCLIPLLLPLASTTLAQQLPLIDTSRGPSAHFTHHSYKLSRSGEIGKCTLIAASPTIFRGHDAASRISVSRPPAIREEHGAVSALALRGDEIIDVRVRDVDGFPETGVQEALADLPHLCQGQVITSEYTDLADTSGSDDVEIIKIVDNGPPENRIDVVFMGDGYTLSERDRFFDDIRRLTSDMFNGTTFATTLPLFNIWAIFKPSKESGIGVGGVPKDTAFGLYRDGTELRGIYCSKPLLARQTCALTGPHACDYPSLIANSPYYGGLGGEFVISTRSKTSGTIVLRHEMGHNFVDVGEEYDGGQVYSGVNSSPNLFNLKWKHWLSGGTGGRVREERSVLRVQDYSWYDLAKGAYHIAFQSDGKYERWFMQISASGVEVDGALEVYLDGTPLGWNTTGNLDRGFHRWSRESGLSRGRHELVFKMGVPPSKGSPIRQLCSVTLHEYGGEDTFRWSNDIVSAYPVWSLYGSSNLSSPNIPVCKEGLWQNLLSKLSLIDSITCHSQTIKVTPLPLAQFRKQPITMLEEMRIKWFRDGKEVEELEGKWKVKIDDDHEFGREGWEVEVEFVTREVRKDKRGVMREKRKLF